MLAIAGLSDTTLAKAYLTSVPEGVAAMLGAMLLFVLPVHWAARKFTITWEEAARIDWGIVLLYGGGLAMGDLAFSTGLATAMGEGLTSWLPGAGPMLLTAVFTGVAILLSETTSNTASANMVVPVAIAVATASKVDPMLPALGATLGASMGFMMPISTAPNAIVYSSGHVPISAMIRYGIVLDLAGFVAIVGAARPARPAAVLSADDVGNSRLSSACGHDGSFCVPSRSRQRLATSAAGTAGQRPASHRTHASPPESAPAPASPSSARRRSAAPAAVSVLLASAIVGRGGGLLQRLERRGVRSRAAAGGRRCGDVPRPGAAARWPAPVRPT